MKILHLSSERSWRGGEQQIAYLIEELGHVGVENFVACRKDSAFEQHCKENQIPHTSFRFSSQFDFSTSLGIAAYSKKIHPDVIHLHSSHGHAAGVWSSILGKKIPLILSRRVDFPISKNILSKFKYDYKYIKKIICVSDAIRKIIAADVKHPERVITIHSGIDLKRFEGVSNKSLLREKYNIPPDHAIIGNTSALADHKDYFTFIDTAEKLFDKGVKATYIIMGDGPMKKEITNYAQSKMVHNHLFFTGFVDNIPELLPELDVFLMTSKTEGLGTSILDAFACKVPVVATDAGGIPEMIEHEKTGLLAPVKNVHLLADEVKRLLSNPDLRQQVIEGATQKLQLFTKQHTAEKTLEVYKEVLTPFILRDSD